jgi:signal transduction histidine kinase
MNLFQKIIPKKLKTKLRLALFAIGFFPFVFILIYIHNMGEKKILDDTLAIHHAQMRMIKKSIEAQLLTLGKELKFLASLDMMNDMIVEDVDKRIAQLLLHKKQDIALNIEMYAVDTQDHIVASTTHEVKKAFEYVSAFKEALQSNRSYFFQENDLYLFSKIDSNLQKDAVLGYLIMKYDLSNLSVFSANQKGIRSLFYFPLNALKIGEMFDDEPFTLQAYHDDHMSEKYLVLNEQFEGVLSNGFIVYMIKKSVALSFLDQFMLFIWVLFVLGVLVIGFISWWIGKRILKPIATLSKTTESIIQTQDYTTQVSLSSEGEIKELTENFNAMIREINKGFQLLEEENKVRLLRFIQLINIFNRLIQTQSEKACIDLALDELQSLIPEQTFSFSEEYPKNDEGLKLMLYVKDFEKELSHFYGVISLSGEEEVTDHEEIRFYQAIATMIMLQLDQIRLIAQTKAVSSAKSTFISHMSHELRTPLHTILSSTQYLIGYEGLSLPQQEKIVTIESSADHLLGMINDILDLVQIESGKVTVNALGVSVNKVEKVLQEVLLMLELLAEQKGLTLTFNATVSEPLNVWVDDKFLKQILINLLSNAIKFTESGGIEVTLQRCDERLCIRVKDSGIGLSEKDLHALFNEFTQVNTLSESTQKGSGLGLAISRKLASLFEAELELKSEGQGRGTEAVLKLKIKP